MALDFVRCLPRLRAPVACCVTDRLLPGRKDKLSADKVDSSTVVTLEVGSIQALHVPKVVRSLPPLCPHRARMAVVEQVRAVQTALKTAARALSCLHLSQLPIAEIVRVTMESRVQAALETAEAARRRPHQVVSSVVIIAVTMERPVPVVPAIVEAVP